MVAILLRLVSALYQGNTVVPLPGIYDQISYDGLARRVIEGHGFSFATGWWPLTPAGEPTAHWSYLYTLYLAVIYVVFGPQPIVARLIQAIVVGVLHTWLVWRIGKQIFGPTTGLVAAGLSSAYAYFFYYAGGLLTETFYIVGILWTFDVGLRLTAQARSAKAIGGMGTIKWWSWLELGLAIGITVLLRQVFLLFVPFLFLWLWWNLTGSQDRASTQLSLTKRIFCWPVLGGFLGATLIVVSLIVPWTVRNYRAFNTFVPLNTNAGYAFFWGNHPIYGTRFQGILTTASYTDLIPDELRVLNEAELDRALLKQGLGFVSDDPVRIFWLSLSRTREYFKFWPSAESSTISNIARVGSFGIALPFILYGLWLSIGLVRQPRQPEQRSQIILLYLFITIYTFVHLVSWALIRYRIPVDATLLIFAAYGLQDLAKRLMLVFGFSQRVPTLVKHH